MAEFPEYICDYCSRSFTRKYNILTHITNCHINDSCFCVICEQKFGSPAGLQLHLSRGHNRLHQPNPECDLCGKIFTRKQNIISHLQTKHSIGTAPEVACEICNRKFTNTRNLRRHIRKLHNPTCTECGKVFRLKESLFAHMQSVHKVTVDDTNRCRLCERVYSCRKNLKRHLRTVHNVALPSDFICEHCSRVFCDKTGLDTHMSLHHKLENKNPHTHPCECGKVFNMEAELRQHVKSDHSFDDFYTYCKNYLIQTEKRKAEKLKRQSPVHTCEVCQEYFGSIFSLRIHMEEKHDLRYYTCNVCFAKFFSQEGIAQHQKECIPPDDVYRCSQCDKLFTAKISLKFHVKVFHPQAKELSSPSSERSSSPVIVSHVLEDEVEERNELKCEYCYQLFKSKRNVKKHIEHVHRGMQRYKCPQCDTHFKESRNLRKHIRSKHPHSSTFPQCHLCRKRFESAQACKIHLKQAHSFVSDTFPCELCSLSYDSSESLNLHMRTKHENDDKLIKCEDCSLEFKGHDIFEKHKEKCQVLTTTQHNVPRCVICMKDFSARKTLKRHIKNFHEGFDPNELAAIGSSNRLFMVDCKDCLKRFTDDDLYKIYLDNKDASDAIVFKCETCAATYNVIEFAVLRYRRMVATRNLKQASYESDEAEAIETVPKSDSSDVEIIDCDVEIIDC